MKEPWDVQAHEMIGYFQSLAERQGDEGTKWLLGLFMARHWMRLITEPYGDLEEARLFLRALEAERPHHGSGWHDLSIRVRYWIDEQERAQFLPQGESKDVAK